MNISVFLYLVIYDTHLLCDNIITFLLLKNIVYLENMVYSRDRTCYLRNAKNVFYVLWQVAQRYIISFWKPLEHNGVS
jgi:hypothetical protein